MPEISGCWLDMPNARIWNDFWEFEMVNGLAPPFIDRVDHWDETCPSSTKFPCPQISCPTVLKCLCSSLSGGGKKERGWGRLLRFDIQESDFLEMSVFEIGLSRDISLYKAWLSGRISKTLASTWSICLVSDLIDLVFWLALGVFLSW